MWLVVVVGVAVDVVGCIVVVTVAVVLGIVVGVVVVAIVCGLNHNHAHTAPCNENGPRSTKAPKLTTDTSPSKKML